MDEISIGWVKTEIRSQRSAPSAGTSRAKRGRGASAGRSVTERSEGGCPEGRRIALSQLSHCRSPSPRRSVVPLPRRAQFRLHLSRDVLVQLVDHGVVPLGRADQRPPGQAGRRALGLVSLDDLTFPRLHRRLSSDATVRHLRQFGARTRLIWCHSMCLWFDAAMASSAGRSASICRTIAGVAGYPRRACCISHSRIG